MADNIELIMRFHPVGGEDVSLISADFGDEAEALKAIAQALNERRGLILARARYNRETAENGMVVNLAKCGVRTGIENGQRRHRPVSVTPPHPVTLSIDARRRLLATQIHEGQPCPSAVDAPCSAGCLRCRQIGGTGRDAGLLRSRLMVF